MLTQTTKKILNNLPVYPALNGWGSCSVLDHHLHLHPVLSSSLASNLKNTQCKMQSKVTTLSYVKSGEKVTLLFSFLCRLPVTQSSSLYPSSFSSSSPWVYHSRQSARRKRCPDSSFPSSLRFQTLSAPVLTASLHTLQISGQHKAL